MAKHSGDNKISLVTEDTTPTPTRTATPADTVLGLKTAINARRVPVSELIWDGEDRAQDSPPSSSAPAGSTDVYDSLLLGTLANISAPGTSPQKLDLASKGSPEQDAVQVHMPSSGLSGNARSSDDGRARTSSSDQPARSSSQRSQPSGTRRTQQQQGRPIYATPPVSYYSQSAAEGYQNAGASSSAPSPPTALPTSYSPSVGTPQYTQRPGFMGPYTLSPQPVPPPPPPFSSQHQHQPQYTYPPPQLHHPGIVSPEAHLPPQFPPLGYSSPTSLAPPAHSQTHSAPMYQYRYSPEGPSSSTPPFPGHVSSMPEHTPALVYDTSPPSGSPHPSQSSSPYSPQHPSQSFTSYNYSTITTSPQFQHYQRDSFPHSTPFQPQYTHSYAYVSPSPSEESQHQAGTWWYIPPGTSPNAPPNSLYDPSQRPYPPVYSVGGYPQRPDLDPYGSRPSAAHTFSSSPSHHYGPSSYAGRPLASPQHPNSASASSSARSSMRDLVSPLSGGQTIAEQSGGESSSDHGHVRRLQQQSTATQRSEWVMWVGNVPSDATHDEVWRYFTHMFDQTRQPASSSSIRSGNVGLGSQPRNTIVPVGIRLPEGNTEGRSPPNEGVTSIFLIQRSNCAFVNYATEAHLRDAISRYNGQQMRPGDPRCPKLVCRVRGKEDDLRAGVGGQRGMGMHTRWIKGQKEKEKDKGKEKDESEDEPPATPSDSGEPSPHTATFSSDDSSRRHASPGRSPPHHSSSSGSYASTTSSFLQKHFPKRYFILKSLTQYDLDLSVERGVWATQPHNESVLNMAFRTSKDVYLIFGVNKSGEFFGYAKMTSPVGKSEERISWASRTESSHSPTASLSSSGRSRVKETIPEEHEGDSPGQGKGGSGDTFLFSPTERRLAESSPQPITPLEQRRLDAATEQGPVTIPSIGQLSIGASARGIRSNVPPATAPAEMSEHHRRITLQPGSVQSETFDPTVLRRGGFPLDPSAPARHARRLQPQGPSSSLPAGKDDRVPVIVHPETRQRSAPAITIDGSSNPRTPGGDDNADPDGERRASDTETQWGTPFRVQWIRVGRLPFHRTRNLRNPWNHDREVKVSRDGTELEPSVGQALLDEWDKPEPPTPAATSPTTGRRGQRAQTRSGTGAESSTSQSQRTPGDRGYS